MNKHGKPIDNSHDTLLDPKIEYIDLETEAGAKMTCDEGAKKLHPSMTCDQRNMYCTGVSYILDIIPLLYLLQ